MSREIPLTRGYVALVDDEDYDRLSLFDWRLARTEIDRRNYASASIGGKTQLMHRVITAAPTGLVVDHINGNGLDNRRSNLRICTARENSKNRGHGSNNATGFKGVSRRKDDFRACIWVDRKHIELGSFKCPIHAAIRYDQAAKQYHGEFARLNFSPDRDWILIGGNPKRGRQHV